MSNAYANLITFLHSTLYTLHHHSSESTRRVFYSHWISNAQWTKSSSVQQRIRVDKSVRGRRSSEQYSSESEMQWTYMVDTCTRFRRIFAPLDMDLLGVFSATIWTCNDASSGKLRRPSAKASTGKKREQKKLISFLHWHGLLSPHCGAMYTKLHPDSVDEQTTAAAILKTFLIHYHIDIRRATSARVRERFSHFSLPISTAENPDRDDNGSTMLTNNITLNA